MPNLRKHLVAVVLATGLALVGASGATASAAVAEPAHTSAPSAGQAPATAAGVTYMGSTRDLLACHNTGLWYVNYGGATYYYCQEYYDSATGRWYALYVGV
ncbi:hypothetical protein [Amycolatopsis mediterranei]|uniref:Secreted protein n=1 Tax=Amycolatopsis mediterranei (strain S699) TaxID=713604 RepID=A0A9R0UAX5_AMYMS|nr:hypothetical protein [Amycolatopsis mediterranei]AEK44145.1 hypothetical protein RAM_28340 [Amycolatopsis mediterranei S699]KDO12496.1 hypothetical protein DV26_02295 [Amycolatopsis mediterranei]KDU88566.1 hypothetical protein DV36_30085 [Amycolatopsis mediterranei]UZF72323.1 hypothetical protein ISP_005662 [Amycolatopsis mediterranei]